MIYLLDVNDLVALGFINHEAHGRLAAWVQSQKAPNLSQARVLFATLERGAHFASQVRPG
jgi:hypothetical protein